jgi:hypothetical protein
MARLATIGFELQSVATGVEIDSNSGTPTIDTTTFRSGLASMRVNGTSISKFISYQYAGAGLAQNRFFRFYLRIHTASGTNAAAFALLRDGTNGNGPSLRMNTNRTLEFWDEQAAAQRGSDSPVLALDTWYRIELQYNRAAGTGNAYIDGVEFANGVQSATLDMNVIRLGMIDTATCDLNFDDLAVNDSSGTSQTGLPGAGGVIRLTPNAGGDANAWLNTAGGAGDSNNFNLVDEVTPDDATTMVQSGILNSEDLYNCTDSGIGASDTINVVQVGMRFRNNTADALTAFKVEIEKTTGGTKTQSASIVPNSTTWKTNATAVPINPPITLYNDPDGSPWTQATLDTMQIGQIDTIVNVNKIQVSTIWATVDYTPASGQAATVSKRLLTRVGV